MNDDRPSGVAWGLSRVGGEVSQRFARRLAPLGLTPSDAATLRTVARGAASQRDLAARMGLVPSRMVALLDGLEARGLVVRDDDEHDRRRHVVHLTPQGRRALAGLREVATAHDAEVVACLDEAEVAQLRRLLTRLEQGLGLSPEGHPGMPGGRGDRSHPVA